jgi:hypothetical protein
MAVIGYTNNPAWLITPAQGFDLLTPSTSVTISPPTRSLYIGVAGTIGFRDLNGTISSGVPVVAGAVIPVRIDLLTTATSATVYAMR